MRERWFTSSRFSLRSQILKGCKCQKIKKETVTRRADILCDSERHTCLYGKVPRDRDRWISLFPATDPTWRWGQPIPPSLCSILDVVFGILTLSYVITLYFVSVCTERRSQLRSASPPAAAPPYIQRFQPAPGQFSIMSLPQLNTFGQM